MKNFHVLQQFLPPGSGLLVQHMLTIHPVNLRISRSRSSRYGDFKPQPGKPFHIISVNHDLNPFAFLITLVHEVAHLSTWNLYENRVLAHGSEWKNQFKLLMTPFLENRVFPESLQHEVIRYMQNPAASSCSSPGLMRALMAFDRDRLRLLEDLPEGTLFILKERDDLLLQKGKKARSRYLCVRPGTRQSYWVNGLAEVVPQPADSKN